MLLIYSLVKTFLHLAKRLNPSHVHLCLEKTCRCRLDPPLGHVQEVTYCFSLTMMHLSLSPKSIEYILYASSSFRSHIMLMGDRKERKSPATKLYNTGQWWCTPAAPSSESQAHALTVALPPLPLYPTTSLCPWCSWLLSQFTAS